MCCGLMRVARGAIGKAFYAEVVFVTGAVGTSNAYLLENISALRRTTRVVALSSMSCAWGSTGLGYATPRARYSRTVDVISEEQTSQTYFTPPSPPLAAIFFLMTPIVEVASDAGGWRGQDNRGGLRKRRTSLRSRLGGAKDDSGKAHRGQFETEFGPLEMMRRVF